VKSLERVDEKGQKQQLGGEQQIVVQEKERK
jgi:hypothetical protein